MVDGFSGLEEPIRPIEGQNEFHSVVIEAMKIYRALEAVDLKERAAKSAATKVADAKRKRLNPQ